MNPYYESENGVLYHGDAIECLKAMPDKSVNCCVTSPPYWGLRDYGVGGQIGLEDTPEKFVEKLVAVFREVKRVLRDDGTCWVNLGDSYIANATGSCNDSVSTLGGGKGTHKSKHQKDRARQHHKFHKQNNIQDQG